MLAFSIIFHIHQRFDSHTAIIQTMPLHHAYFLLSFLHTCRRVGYASRVHTHLHAAAAAQFVTATRSFHSEHTAWGTATASTAHVACTAPEPIPPWRATQKKARAQPRFIFLEGYQLHAAIRATCHTSSQPNGCRTAQNMSCHGRETVELEYRFHEIAPYTARCFTQQ